MHWTQSSHFMALTTFDVILMIHLLCLLTIGSEVWQAVYSLSPGVWSFVTIRSCNHLMRFISSMSTTQRKVRSREDDNYLNWVIINYGVYKGLYHISCLLQIIKPFICPPQGLLFLVVKTF